MRVLLLIAGFVLASLFGLSAVALPNAVSADTKYLAPFPVVVKVDTEPVLGPCTPSAAQAAFEALATYKDAAEPAKTKPCAMPGGASLGVAT